MISVGYFVVWLLQTFWYVWLIGLVGLGLIIRDIWRSYAD